MDKDQKGKGETGNPNNIATITRDEWQKAFYKAESDTVDHFPEHSDALCGAKNEDGNYECPLCYFSIQLKEHLGIFPDSEGNAKDKGSAR